VKLSEEEWEAKLTTEQYRILRQKGTEAPFSGELLEEKRDGMFMCVACGNQLFASNTKFDSGSGWPSFYDVAKSDAVKLLEDNSLGVNRVEVECAKCGGHLGHVFDDGPADRTGQRYCINSVCLKFDSKKL
jgi:peptide-methionine (R)-S-oxide reductase